MIFNGRIFHETIKGIDNKKLYLDINDRIFRDAIQEFENLCLILKNMLDDIFGMKDVKKLLNGKKGRNNEDN